MDTSTKTSRSEPVRVVVAGPDGHMGSAVVAGLAEEPTVTVVDGIRRGDSDLVEKLTSADVLLDFTHADAAPKLMLAAIETGVRPISGTSGIPEDALHAVDESAKRHHMPAVWAPTFEIGAVVLGVLARLAARYMNGVEVIEGHPARKADAPSGTALALARAIRQGRGADFDDPPVQNALLDGIRGAVVGGVRIHSVRHPIPTMVSWHQVVFTSDDGVLTLRHDHVAGAEAISEIVRTIHEVMGTDRTGLIRGYDSVVGLDLDAPSAIH